ncbi:MAG: hypothetical protein Q9182_000660 [Xanthomendoza sp. 2 TL-2023]
MAPSKQSSKANLATKSSSSENEDQTPIMGNGRCASQGSDDQSVENMAKALKESTKRRRSARRSKIEKDYHLEMKKLETSVTASLNNILDKRLKLHRARLETLKALLERRSSIETEMSKSNTRLEKAFANANYELQTVLATRIENCKVDTT